MNKPKARVLDPDILYPDGSLDVVQRLLWTVILARVADDQGRLRDEPVRLRYEVFPGDSQISDADVINALKRLQQLGKITRYEVQGYHLIQVVDWWQLQSPPWAYVSHFPPPPKWTDRIRCHMKGYDNEIQERHWNDAGGFARSLRRHAAHRRCGGRVRDGDKEKKKENNNGK